MRKVSISLLVRIAVVLALLVSVGLVTAAPAGAVNGGYAVAVAPATAGRIAQYTIGPFTGTANVTTGGTIQVTFPAGTNLTNAALLTAGNVTVNGVATTVAQAVAGQVVTVTVPAGVTAGDAVTPLTLVFLAAAKIVNPTTPSVTSSSGLVVNNNYTVSVVTSADATVGTSTVYVIGGETVTLSNAGGGVVSAYTIPHLVGQIGAGTYVAATSTLTFTFPSGITLPATISRSTVTVSRGGADIGYPSVDPTVDTVNRLVTVTMPAVQLNGTTTWGPGVAGDTITVTFSQTAGIVNPKTATSAAGRITSMADAGAYNGGTEAAGTTANITYVRQMSRSPTAGGRGSTITLSGNGFAASSGITFTVGGVNIGSTTSASDGTFTATVTANVPPLAAGANTINAVDGFGGAGANAAFSVLPSIVLSPTSGPTGSVVSITPRDFLAGATIGANAVTIAGIAGTNAAQAAPNVQNGVAFNFTLPNVVPIRAQLVVVTDATNAGNVATATFTVGGRTVTVTPSSAAIGASITIQGTGFTANSTVNANFITLQSQNWNIVGTGPTGTGVVPTDNNGNFVVSLPLGGNNPNLLALENLPAGQALTVMVTDAGGLQGTSVLTIKPRAITVSPATAARGALVSVTGSNFRVNGQTTIQYNTNLGATLATATGTNDGSGNFVANITVPNNAGLGSTNTILAMDTVNGANIQANATVNVPAAAITAPASASAGQTITVTGTGFPAYSVLTNVTIGGIPAIPVPPPATDANGNFTANNILVPAVSTGTQPLVVTAGATTASAAITITGAIVTPANSLAALITANALNAAFSPAPANPGKFLSYIPNVPGNTLTSVQTYQTVIVNITVAGQAIPAGYRGQPGQTTLSVGVNFLTYAP